MNALTWRGGSSLTFDRIPAPEPGDGEVAFDVSLAGICGSDLHPYRGHAGPRVPPLVLGHEAVGTSPTRPGERFVLFPLVGCSSCAACLRGEINLCRTRGLVGLDRQGVFADRLVVSSEALTPIPSGVADRVAVLTEPLAASVSALRHADVGPDDRVLVLGGGPIGLLAAHACAVSGIDVSLVEPLDERRRFAAVLGAQATYASTDEVVDQEFDLAIDAVGGLGQTEGLFSAGDVVRRGITVRGHYAYTRADFENALAILARRPPSLEWLRSLPLSEGAEGFRLLVEEPEVNIKILLERD